MTTRLIDKEWGAQFSKALNDDSSYLRIICPFIKSPSIKRLLSHKPNKVRVITRANLADFASGVSDLGAIEHLIDANARVRGIKHLHAKLYIFGKSQAIITSANLTEAALTRNHEFGLVTDDPESVKACLDYFDKLWKRGKPSISLKKVKAWDEVVTDYRRRGGKLQYDQELPDHGADTGMFDQTTYTSLYEPDSRQAFVKFLGSGDNRELCSTSIIDELKGGGCHRAAYYPRDRRPRQVKDGDVIFMGRLMKNPNDTIIFGRAIGKEYKAGSDDATDREFKFRDWIQAYPHYIRVYDPEFLMGTLQNGVSLYDLMNELGADAFESTQRRAKRGEVNINPRKSVRQQPAVRLSPEGFTWLSKRLESAFSRHGKIPNETLRGLYWP